jgi:hypothetical protein
MQQLAVYILHYCKVPPTNDYLITELTYHILWLVLVAHEVLSTSDDGCKEHPKHVERSCSEIKYTLLTAASRWKPIYIILYYITLYYIILYYIILYYIILYYLFKLNIFDQFIAQIKPRNIFFKKLNISTKQHRDYMLSSEVHITISTIFFVLESASHRV